MLILGLGDQEIRLRSWSLYREELFYAEEARFWPEGRGASDRRVYSFPIAIIMNSNKFCG